MKAVLLVGGEGTRLRPLTFSTPKAMVPIVNRPFLAHMTEYLKGHGIDDIVLTMCYLPDPIKSHFGDGSGSGIKLTYTLEESPLGTAGAVKNVSRGLDDTFLVFNGDVFTDIDLTAMLELHRRAGAKATIALTPVEDPSIYGVVETDASGRVRRFVEKPKREEATTNMINAGIYILSPEVLELIPDGRNFSFEHGLFPALLDRGDPVYSFPSDAYWIDIGTPEKYLKVNRDLLQGRVNRELPGERIADGVWLDGDADIHPQAQLEAPLAIGKGCIIDKGARIKGPSVIGANCHIGDSSLIAGAIMWRNARIGQGASLRDCIIAENVAIGDRSQVTEGCVLGHDVNVGDDERLASDSKIYIETGKD